MLLVEGSNRGPVETRKLAVPGFGTTPCYIVNGHPDADAIVELHGWMATWKVNFGRVGDELNGFNRYGFDMPGHGRGPHGMSYPEGEGFLEACAEYVAGGIRELGLKKVIVVGCSMGVAAALLLWKHHPDLVQAMVLSEGGESYPQADRIARPAQTVERHLRQVHHNVRRVGAHAANLGLFRPVPILRETARNDLLNVLQAGLAIRRFEAAGWLGDIDVPTAVVMTERDRIVRKWRQEALHAAIPGALRYSVDGGHFAPGLGNGFATQLGHAVRDVADLSSLPVTRRSRSAATAKRSRAAASVPRGALAA